MKFKNVLLILFLIAAVPYTAWASKKHNAYGQKHYTVESSNFRIHYHRGLDHLVPRVANKLEQLHEIFAETYHIKLPQKTDVVLYESEIPDAFAYPNFNFIYLGVHDYEYNLRGSSDWFDDVLTHEYAHVVSIATGFKFPPSVPHLQFGYFTHPNSGVRFEGLHVFPTDIMPMWFLEGIAQYESSRRGADKWDTHRDMIMRTLTLSGKTLSWPHMQVFTGRGDDFEKTYNHGFSLVAYISETYGYEKVASLLRESKRVDRLSFDSAIKSVLGISGRQLYSDWRQHLSRKYKAQISAIGEQTFGRKISIDGYDNGYPRFSTDGGKIFFVSNSTNDYSFRSLFSYTLSDTIKDNAKKIKFEMPVSSNYDIHAPSGKIAYVSRKSSKSIQDPKRGGQRTFDLFIDTLPPEKGGRKIFGKKTEKQVTVQKSVFAAAFSPKGDQLACAVRKFDRFFLAITDTAGKDTRIVYPAVSSEDNFFKSASLPQGSDSVSFSTIFSLDWSPDGKLIAVDYIDGENRRIGVYDIHKKTFSIICETEHDQRNPYFNSDGSALYFSSDRTGIFNIFRYVFAAGKLERVTNVSGGAFHPALSPDGKKLVYSGYDKDGYGIYLLDTIKTLQTQTITDEAGLLRSANLPQEYSVPLSNRSDYSRFPKQFLAVPTILAEQPMTHDNDETRGVGQLKAGVVLNFMDPLAWADVGNEFGAFFLVDISRITEFINLDKGLISPAASYDAGIFATSRMLPVKLEGEVMVRGIAGEDWFYEESEDTTMVLPYRIQLSNVLIGATHPIGAGLQLQLFTGLNSYDVALDLEEAYGEGVFSYNLGKGYRAGALVHFANQAVNSRSNISPTGLAGKLQYSLWHQYSLKEENSFSFESSGIKEHYDTYLFHQLDGRVLLGMNSPLYPKHDLHLTFGGSYVKAIGDQEIPSFYLPIAQVPGYTFFYKNEITKIEYNDTSVIKQDTVLVTGKAVLLGEFSYRFPLWPRSIDRKLSFLYLDRLYGALNFSAGGGWDKPTDVFNFDRSDWLFGYGAELRLEALSFNSYPLALKFRWDYGADKTKAETFADKRKVTLGGHRYCLSIGFSFDNWDMIPVVDYFSPSRFKESPDLRFGK
ncbi:MAG: hypothetical protein LBI42_13395 [Chitinispirillales bacterium]|jgi:Tol biopolymer transport system component|nr:hypothetical protein [Chitinispirillales bacterium]